MSVSVTAPAAPAHRTFVAACQASWQALPTMVAVSVAWTLGLLPVVGLAIAGVPSLAMGLVGPWLLLSSSLMGVVSAVTLGRSALRGARDGLDPIAVGAIWAACLAAAFVASLDGPVRALGFALAALIVLVGPLVLAYGAVRGRHGLSAIRGGVLLAALRSDLAVSIGGMAVLATFAIVITAGALGLCLPALVATFTCLAVRAELQRRGVDTE